MTDPLTSKSDSGSPSTIPTQNNAAGGCSPQVIATILVAIIACISAIVVAILAGAGPIIQCWIQPYTCPPPATLMPTLVPAFASTPAISISNDVRDINGNPIAMNSAPFEVKVSVTVSNADGLYVYLIVANPYDHYVQPGLGQNVDGDFSVSAYLGIENVKDGLQYTIYAVVTDKPYIKQASFKGESFIAKSKEIMLIRESAP